MGKPATNKVSTPGSRRHIATLCAESRLQRGRTPAFHGQSHGQQGRHQSPSANMLELLGAFAQGGM